MRNIWRRFSKTQQTQILVLATALTLGLYTLWYISIYKDINRSQQMIDRRLNRMEARAAPVPQPKNTATTEKQIKELTEQLALSERNVLRLLQRFVPLDSPEQQQALRRELSTLSSGLGMRVIKLEGALQRSSQSNKAPELDETSEIDKRLGRPLLIFEAWGSYFALQTLLEELNSLSYTVAPMMLRITADEPKMSARQALETQQILRINMVLAI